MIRGNNTMKKKMNEIINSLTGDDFDTLRKIISLQYRKFIRFYRLIEEYIDDIRDLQYEFYSAESLNVLLAFNDKSKVKDAEENIHNGIVENNYDGHVSTKKDRLYITLILQEEDEVEEKNETSEENSTEEEAE